MEEIYAVRGATTAAMDSIVEVDAAVKELMETIYKENGLTDDDLASVIFSQTIDIRTRNAAAACRKAGFCSSVPLFCLQEADVAGGLKMCIRVLVTVNHKRLQPAKMAYLRGASILRPDLNK